MTRVLIFLLACSVFAFGHNAYALKSDTRQPINIRARSVAANEKTGVSVYRGNVVLTQGSLRLEAQRVEVTLRNGRTRLVRAWGNPVHMRSRTDHGETVRATAERAVYHAEQRNLDLHGNVELYRNADIFTGDIVHYALDEETFTAEGNDNNQVTAIIQPASTEPVTEEAKP